jgi:Family of unknown function (DUF6653)
MRVMSDKTWRRHSNPWSVWTRMVSFPLPFVPLWTRRWWLLVPISVWFWLNPRAFPAPADDHAGATRAVLGEQLWTSRGRPDAAAGLAVFSTCTFLFALWSAYRRRPRPLLAGAATLGLNIWVVQRMVRLCDESSRIRLGSDRLRAGGKPKFRWRSP